MTPSKLRAEVVADRVAWVREMLVQLRRLPLGDYADFEADTRNAAAAESYLRRALEALLDLGRHVLAKGFGRPVTEYKEIAELLATVGVLDDEQRTRLREMAGYRNRLMHFYDQVSQRELFDICAHRTADIEGVLEAILHWVRSESERSEDPSK